MIGSVVVAWAIPLLWPVYLAIGWYETQAATRVDTPASVPSAFAACL
ncbi:MAG: hypothetical protein Q8K58_16030 [Acidimicrobiales bacterium]|nr:hypothetical protein [Acidimicrobiales bacterium]